MSPMSPMPPTPPPPPSIITPWFRPMVADIANSHSLDPDHVEAVVMQESGGKVNAMRFEPDFYGRYIRHNPHYIGAVPTRVASSYGLMQVMYTTAVDHGFTYPDPEYLFIPTINLEYGCRVLEALLAWAQGDVWKATAAYNGGRGNWDGPGPQVYWKRVMGWYVKIRHREGKDQMT